MAWRWLATGLALEDDAERESRTTRSTSASHACYLTAMPIPSVEVIARVSTNPKNSDSREAAMQDVMLTKFAMLFSCSTCLRC